MLFATQLMAILMSSVRNPVQKEGLKALWNLDGVSVCALNHSALVYNNYGCYCGMGGSHQPIDGIDRCCQLHDECYADAVSSGSCDSTLTEYLQTYVWNCDEGKPTCAEKEKCGAALCKCDVDVVKCWGQFKEPQNRKECTFNAKEVVKQFYSNVFNKVVKKFSN